jgi:hypothetical protein
VKSITLALFVLLVAMTALAAEPTQSGFIPSGIDNQLLFKPSQKSLIEGYYASGLVRAAGAVSVAYDAKGNVMGVKLTKSTRSSSLDKVIMAWAAQVKIKTTAGGIVSIPFAFAPY